MRASKWALREVIWKISEDEAETDEDYVTRYGRVIRPVARLINEMSALGLSESEATYFGLISLACKNDLDLTKFACVGTGLGGGFTNTNELHVMKFDEAMKTHDASKWLKAVKKEHDKMQKFKVWEPIPESEMPKGANILTSTWAMKKSQMAPTGPD